MRTKLLVTTAIINMAFCLSARAEGERYVITADQEPKELSGQEYTGYDTHAATGSQANYGSLAYVIKGTLKIADGANVYNNKARYGGAIFNNAGILEIGKTTFDGNQAERGGVIYSDGAGAKVSIADGSAFTNNRAALFENSAASAVLYGGVLYNGNSTAEIGKNVTFSGNSAGYGGALFNNAGTLTIGNNAVFSGNSATIYGGAILNNKGTLEIGSNAVFSHNISAAGGGAITILSGSLKIGDGALFEYNESNGSTKDIGGALYISNEEDIAINQATFRYNKNTGNGGAIGLLNTDIANTLTITNSKFEGNEAAKGTDQMAGAIYVSSGNMVIKDSTFTGNKANWGGAIYTSTGSMRGVRVELDNVTFDGNSAKAAGAIGNFASKDAYDKGGMVIKNSRFINNKATDAEAEGAAALFLGSVSVTELDNVTFENNTSAASGGAIGVRSAATHNNRGSLTIANSKFVNNTAATTGGAMDNYFKNVTIKNTTFSGNSAAKGGAIYNHEDADIEGRTGILNLEGKVTFEKNTASGKLNDIHNLGEIKVAENAELTLEGGISGETGTIEFAKGTVLNVKQDVTIVENTVASEGTTLNVVLTKGAKVLELNDIFTHKGNEDALHNIHISQNNALYTLVPNEDDASLYHIVQNSASDVASALGIGVPTVNALYAVVSSDAATENEAFNTVSDTLYEAAQLGNTQVVREAEKLGADTAPVVRVVETMRSNVVLAAANDAMNGASGAIAEGMSAGDYLNKAKIWLRGLFNHADKESTSKAAGFDADTYGAAMGIDKELGNDVKVGAGYAYSQTDVNGNARGTDVNSNTLFVYGRYKPANWYINTALAFSTSNYDEKKSVLGYDAGAKYEVETWALQSMYGYEGKLGGYELNPEIGLRYMHIAQDSYADNLGSRVEANDSDVLTLVAGTKIAKDYKLENGTVLRPEIKAAVTYDVTADDNKADVVLANGAGFRVNGEKLERLGFEVGAKIATEFSDNWEISAGYEGRFRKDYQDHTGLLNVKYKF